MAKKAVCLVSGGLDSATSIAVARGAGFELYAMTFLYGQRHAIETAAAKLVAAQMGAKEHKLVKFDLTEWGGSALTDPAMEVPEGRKISEMSESIPASYVPARNTIFLAFALAWAETLKSSHIFAGMNAVDYSGYPDCRPEYIEAYQKLMDLATREGVEGRQQMTIHTPLIHLSKKDIIELGSRLGVDYSVTHSCYNPQGTLACGKCDSCIIRRQAFTDLGRTDPVRYVAA
jgi:7-cyano-7-deazaguanine synthase